MKGRQISQISHAELDEKKRLTERLHDFLSMGGEKMTQEIISKLIFISKIKENEVVDVSHLSVQDVGWITSLYRTFIARGESRETTLEFITGITHEAIEQANLYIHGDEHFIRQVGDMILGALEEAKNGINNLKKTYQSDRLFVSKIETLLKTLDIKIESITAKKSVRTP